MAFYLRFWSPRSDSNRRPSDYETDARRRPGRLQTDRACSRWTSRRSRRLPTDPEGSTGMIKWMIKAHPTRIGCQGKQLKVGARRRAAGRRGSMTVEDPDQGGRIPTESRTADCRGSSRRSTPGLERRRRRSAGRLPRRGSARRWLRVEVTATSTSSATLELMPRGGRTVSKMTRWSRRGLGPGGRPGRPSAVASSRGAGRVSGHGDSVCALVAPCGGACHGRPRELTSRARPHLPSTRRLDPWSERKQPCVSRQSHHAEGFRKPG